MKAIFRSTFLLSGSSVLSILIGLVSAKFFAEWLGPTGVGYMGLLNGLAGLAAMVAGMGIGTGLVRAGASALARGDRGEVAVLHRAAWFLTAVSGGAVAILLVVFRDSVSHVALGGAENRADVVFVGIALLLTLSAGLQTSTLNAHHRVATLARYNVLQSLMGAGIGLTLAWRWHEDGIAPGMIMGGISALAITSYFVRREVPRPSFAPTPSEVRTAGRSLLRFGVPYTGSMFVGAGVQLVFPIVVLHSLDQQSVGFYRASVSISVGYLGFLLTAMAQDYYPRVSAANGKPTELVHLANQQLRLVLLLCVPMLLGVMTLAPYVIPIIYTSEFAPTVRVLEWQLIGDLFKFASWTMSYVVLASQRSTVFFVTELAGGIAMLGASWIGMQWLGLEGIGLGFLVAYIVYFLVVWQIVRRAVNLRLTKSNVVLLMVAIGAAGAIRMLSQEGLEEIRTPVALLITVLVGCNSLALIFGDLRRDDNRIVAVGQG